MEKKGKKSNNNYIKDTFNDNKILIFILFVIVAFALVLTIIQRNSKDKVVSQDNEIITIRPTGNITINVGSSINLVAMISNETNAVINWSSSDTSVATVNNGTVNGVKVGKTVITATYIKNDKKYSVSKDVTVINGESSNLVTDIILPEGDLYMPINSEFQLSFTVSPSNASIYSKSFKTGNSNIVTVDDNGLVRSIKEGHARIIIDVNNTYKKSIDVYVGNDYTKSEIIVGPSNISFNSNNIVIKKGASEKLVYSITPSNSDKTKLTWTSSDSNIVTVNNGEISGINEGVAIVSLSSMNGQRDDITVLVYSDFVEVDDILLSTNTINMQAGTNQIITPTISPSNASNKTIGFISSNSEIVSISNDSNGAMATLSALKAGTAEITVSSGRIEKKIIVVVTGTSTNEIEEDSKLPTNIRVRSDKNNLAKTYDEAKKIPVSGITNATVSMDIGVGKIKYCVGKYGSNLCNPNVELYTDGSILIPSGGLYVLRVIKYDYDDNEIPSTSTNYIDGVLNYYINTNTKEGDIKLKQYEVAGAYFNSTYANNNPLKQAEYVNISLNDKTRHLYICYTQEFNCTPNIRVSNNYKAYLNKVGLWRVIVAEYDSNNNKLGKTEIYYAKVKETTNAVSPTPTSNPKKDNNQKTDTNVDKSTNITSDSLELSNIKIENQILIGKYLTIDVKGNDKFTVTRFCYIVVDKGKKDVCKLDLTSNSVPFHNGASYFHAEKSDNTYYAYFNETNNKTLWFDIDGLDNLYDNNNTKKDVIFSFAIGKKVNNQIKYSNPINIRINMTNRSGSSSYWNTEFVD